MSTLTASRSLCKVREYQKVSAVAPGQSGLRGIGLGDKKRAKAGIRPWLEAEQRGALSTSRDFDPSRTSQGC
jgi:hypothetical protein